MTRRTIAVTGATGFVGSALVAALEAEPGLAIRALARTPAGTPSPNVDWRQVGDIASGPAWTDLLLGVDVVVHLAARAHVLRERGEDPLGEYRRVNVAGSVRLARAAAAAGVRRFVYLSSIKVNGERGRYTEHDAPAPRDAYGISKLEAENSLRGVSGETGMEVVIIRPPLVYGPGVTGNFRSLLRMVRRGIPLPLGAVDNRRSLIALDNLIDFILACTRHPAAADQTFLVCDGEDLSTTSLIERLARALGRHAHLLAVRPEFLAAAAAVLGRRDLAQRLLGSLQVDMTKAIQLLGWTPPITVDQGLERAVAGA